MAVRHVLGDGADDWTSTGYDLARRFLLSPTQDFYEDIDAGGGDDTINGFGGSDTIDGGTGHDSLMGNEGYDSLIGGAGNDTLDGGIGDDTLAGGTGDDQLRGGAGLDLLDGGNGRDLLSGGDSADTLLGASGHDTLRGDAGNDLLVGGSHDDRLEGGAGNDVLHAGGRSAEEPSGGGIDVLDGGTGDDQLFSGLFGDTAAGDRLYGGAGQDIATISLGNATIGVTFLRGVFDGSAELRGTNDMRIARDIERLSISGSAFADGLLGGDGGDTLSGGGGHDRLIGGAGRDVLTGGTGADTFVWSQIGDSGVARGTRDLVTDFETGIYTGSTGYVGDRLDFSDIDARQSTAANDAFAFIGRAAFDGHAGQLRFSNGTDITRVEGDVNGDAVADFVVELAGLHELRMDGGFANFIL